MANEKAICPHCKPSKNIRNMIFQVNTNADKCFCPRCMAKLKPSEAVGTYKKTLKEMLKKAEYSLFVIGDCDKSYKLYADIISIDSTCIEAYFGRILSLLSHSTVRNSFFKDARVLLEEESVSIFHKTDKVGKYMSFIVKATLIIDEYDKGLRKKILFRKYYYDSECIKLYLTRVNEMIAFKNLLKKEADYFVKHSDMAKPGVISNAISHDLERLNKILTSQFVCIDGKSFTYDRTKKNGEVLLKAGDPFPIGSQMNYFRMATLDSKDKELRVIDDVIFKNYSKFLKHVTPALICFATFSVITAVLLSLLIALRDNKIATIVTGSLSSFVFILTVVSLTLFIISKITLENRKKRLNR